MPLEPERYEEAVLEFAFGDGEMDPAFLVAETAQSEAHREHLDRLMADVTTFKSAAGFQTDDSPALLRMRALAAEADALRHPSNVVELSSERAKRSGRIKFFGGGALLALAAGLAIFFLMKSTPQSPGPGQPPAAVAELKPEANQPMVGLEISDSQKLTERLPAGAHSFSGPAASGPFAVGYLSSAVTDLSLVSERSEELDGQQTALVNRILAKRDDAPEADSERLVLVLKGCGSLLSEAELEPCLHGGFAYRLLRDISLSRPEANARAASREATHFLKWVIADAGLPEELRSQARSLASAKDADTETVMTGWLKLLSNPAKFIN